MLTICINLCTLFLLLSVVAMPNIRERSSSYVTTCCGVIRTYLTRIRLYEPSARSADGYDVHSAPGFVVYLQALRMCAISDICCAHLLWAGHVAAEHRVWCVYTSTYVHVRLRHYSALGTRTRTRHNSVCISCTITQTLQFKNLCCSFFKKVQA